MIADVQDLLSNKDKRLLFIIVFVFLATSGFPSFMQLRPFICLFIPYLLYRIKENNIFIPKLFYTVIILVFLFSVLHFLFGHFTFIGAVTFVLDVITYSLVVLLMKDHIGRTFVNVMKVLSVISLLLWLLIVLMPGFYSFLVMIGNVLPQFMSRTWMENTSNSGVSLYLYFLPTNSGSILGGFFRNCGPFFEPGLFASYLTVAIILNISATYKLFSKNNLVLVLALLTTFSSAGYVSFLLIVIYVAVFSRNKIVKALYWVALLLLWQPLMNLDFMSEKISNNMSRSSEQTDSRFGAVLYHTEKIIESPLLGYAGGKLPMTKMDRTLGNIASERVLSPNGLSLVFVFWGIPLGIFFYVYLFRFIKRLFPLKKRMELSFIYLILLSAAFSQTITNGPIIITFVLSAIFNIYGKERFKNRCNSYL